MFTDGSIFESGGTLFKKRVIRDFNDVRKKKKERERFWYESGFTNKFQFEINFSFSFDITFPIPGYEQRLLSRLIARKRIIV